MLAEAVGGPLDGRALEVTVDELLFPVPVGRVWTLQDPPPSLDLRQQTRCHVYRLASTPSGPRYVHLGVK